MIKLDKKLSSRKDEILAYFRQRGLESLKEINGFYGTAEYKKRAGAINKSVIGTKIKILQTLLQKADRETWNNEEVLRCVLLITYCSYIVMIELRNDVWPYEYMTFSRRIGELWDPFCQTCFEYPLKELELFVPPLFSEVKQRLTKEIEDYIDALEITDEQKDELKKYYKKVWSFVTSGEIKLELDLHFLQNDNKYIVDFKSGFGSNEKGNTNRLLLVATIYKNLEENYQCLLLVRADEDKNNHYFQTLKNSGIWEAYCGKDTYSKIEEYSGFDIGSWIENNISWSSDFRPDTMKYFKDNELSQYLKW